MKGIAVKLMIFRYAEKALTFAKLRRDEMKKIITSVLPNLFRNSHICKQKGALTFVSITAMIFIILQSARAQSWSELGGLNGLSANSSIFSVCNDASGNIYAAGDFSDSLGNRYV